MPPLSPHHQPRVVVYYQTIHDPEGKHISVLPLVTQPGVKVTHLNVAAIHLNEPPGNITLNDHPPHHPRYTTMWAELRLLQASGIKVLGMLGGAAKGSYMRLDLADELFEAYYLPLASLIRTYGLDGLDLDVEEETTLAGIIRLIDRLKADFGNDFIITLAPVAAALMSDRKEHNLSGFSYEALEVMRGKQIAWYNAQFYCGWGDVSTTQYYDMIMARGFPPEKVVMGMVTNGRNGAGWVDLGLVKEVLINLRRRYPRFGGVMGWEYFNSLPGDRQRPWEWAGVMSGLMAPVQGGGGGGTQMSETMSVVREMLGHTQLTGNSQIPAGNATAAGVAAVESEGKGEVATSHLIDGSDDAEDAALPSSFDYYTDGSLDE